MSDTTCDHQGVPGLQSLALSGHAVGKMACRAIGSLQSLTSLELLHCSELNDGDLCLLEPLTSLQRLALGNCEQVTDIGVARLLRVCRGLRHVQLAHVANLTALSLQALHGLPLVTLDLSGSMVRLDEIVDDDQPTSVHSVLSRH